MAGIPYIAVAVAEIEHGDDEDRSVNLPAKYEICSQCRGTGGHSLRFGAITQSDRDENWDEDSFAAYMRGDYDEKCEPCDGTGKVLVIDRDAIRTDEQKAALAKYDADAEAEADFRAEQEAEMRYCYGPNY